MPLEENAVINRLAASKTGITLDKLHKRIAPNMALRLFADFLEKLRQKGLIEFKSAKYLLTAAGHRNAKSARTITRLNPTVGFESKPKTELENNLSTLSKEIIRGKRNDFIQALEIHVSQIPQADKKASQIGQSVLDVEPGPLLRYYKQCLAAEERVDLLSELNESGKRFLAVRPVGSWTLTRDKTVRFSVSQRLLPEEFLQNLARSKGKGSVYLGYPLETFKLKTGGYLVRAIASTQLRWNTSDRDTLTFETIDASVTLNAGWIAYNRKQVDVPQLARTMGIIGDLERDDLEEDILPPIDLADLCRALNMAFAMKRVGEINPKNPSASLQITPGIQNVAALFIAGSAKFSAAAIRDLEALSNRPRDSFGGTAFGAIIGSKSSVKEDWTTPVIEPVSLTYNQLEAVRAGLAGPFTVITGPPGTGKSQVVAALLASAALSNRTAILASRNHAAIDAVEERIGELSPNRPLLVRLNRKFNEGTGVRPDSLIRDLVGKPEIPQDDSFQRKIRATSILDRERKALMIEAAAIAAQKDEISGLESELDSTLAALNAPLAEVLQWPTPVLPSKDLRLDSENSFLPKAILERLKSWRRRRQHHSTWEELGAPAAQHEAVDYDIWVYSLARTHEIAGQLPQLIQELPSEDRLVTIGDRIQNLTTQISKDAASLTSTFGKYLDQCSEEDRRALMELKGLNPKGALPADAIRILLKHFPLWACSNLVISRFAPLDAPLFDYVVIDEASQCDIASAIPLLVRAKRAIIVGDPAQLGTISKLAQSWEDECLAQNNLLATPGIGRYRQSRNSLFDLASTAIGVKRYFLKDHFRCHEEIVSYFEAVYDGHLSVLTDTSALKPPVGYKPGIHWQDVRGSIEGADKGCHSPSEAVAILEALIELLQNQKYDGTVGVCTPFREQARRINDLITANLDPKTIREAKLISTTANGFQGDARDVMLFSLCLSPETPPGSRAFLSEGTNLFTVAVSRAKAVLRVFGNKQYAAQCGIRHVERLLEVSQRANSKSYDQPSFDSPWEETLFRALKSRNIECVPQFPIAGRRLDLAWFNSEGLKLDIEVDGDRFHRDASGLRKADDIWRDHQLRGLGWKVLRFWVYELRENLDGCVNRVQRAISGT